GRLIRPFHFSVVDIDRHNGIGHWLRRIGIGISRRNVNAATPEIHRGCRPDRTPSRPPGFLPGARILSAKLGFFDKKRSPDNLTGTRIERRQAATKFTAWRLAASAAAF